MAQGTLTMKWVNSIMNEWNILAFLFYPYNHCSDRVTKEESALNFPIGAALSSKLQSGGA